MGNFLLYKSSAGSGKTSALVGVFLRLILSDPSPDSFRKVLAITFTNKATAEMKERLLLELSLLSAIRGPYEGGRYIVDALLEELKLDFNTLQERARATFVRMLFDYGDLSISTIDHFNHKLIRAFSSELGLRHDFQVELDDRSLFGEAVERVVERTGSDPTLTAHLVAYIVMQQDEEKKSNIIEKLKELQTMVMSEDAVLPLALFAELDSNDLKALAAKLTKEQHEFENKLRTLGKEAAAFIRSLGAENEDLIQKNRSWLAKFDGMQTVSPGKFEITKTLRQNADKWRPNGKHAKPEVADRLEASTPELTAFAERAIKLYDEDYQHYCLSAAVKERIHLLATLNDLRNELDNLCAEYNVLPISYFNRKVSSSLRNEPVAYIYENIGARYKHLLLDEFQDTSVMQWNNLLPLVAESLGSGNVTMLVGDAKQSIYRWRGGKAEQFIALPELFPQDSGQDPVLEALLKDAVREFPLKVNYRSAGNIITLNNLLFSALASSMCKKELYLKEYAGVAQAIPKKAEGKGYVEINALGSKPPKGSHERLVFQQVKELAAHGYQYDDICILVRKRKLGAKIANFLMDQGVAVRTSDSRSAESDEVVRMLLGMMRLHVQPEHNAAAISAMRSLCMLRGLKYRPQRYRKPISVRNKKQHIALADFLREHGLPQLQGAWFSEGAYQACENLLLHYVPEQHARPAVQALLNYMLEEGGMTLTVADFFRHWDGPGENPGAGNATGSGSVQMLTIHKSKGLQFKACIVPEINWKISPTNDEQWVPLPEPMGSQLPYAPLKVTSKLNSMGLASFQEEKSAADHFDNLNLLYVAFTRAEEVLMLNYHKSTSAYIGDAVDKGIDIALSKIAEGRKKPVRLIELQEEEQAFSWSFGSLEATSKAYLKAKPQEKSKNGEDGDSQLPLVLAPAVLHKHPWQQRIPLAFDSTVSGSQHSRRMGIYFHQIAAEHVNAVAAHEWLNNAARQGMLDAAEVSQLADQVELLFSDPQYVELCKDAHHFREREISFEGEVLRPDLILRSKTAPRWVVIDFKTGAATDAHQAQVRRYMKALPLETNEKVEGYVRYLNPIQWVPCHH